ncbi:hypothetical protein L915_21779 [Phytophthora nicotianae]|uniref:Ankyrin repeat protein n=1 Tax=Phytophthora nicotianae TaxID=4792 RepID=W2FJB9_PHYNI|nr:hypothetical protein L915_21779 [Phytophthora nicotianae]
MPLMYAVKRNFVELVRYLVLEAGAIVNKKYEMGVPELYTAYRDDCRCMKH